MDSLQSASRTPGPQTLLTEEHQKNPKSVSAEKGSSSEIHARSCGEPDRRVAAAKAAPGGNPSKWLRAGVVGWTGRSKGAGQSRAATGAVALPRHTAEEAFRMQLLSTLRMLEMTRLCFRTCNLAVLEGQWDWDGVGEEISP